MDKKGSNQHKEDYEKETYTPYIGGGAGFATLHLSDTFGTDTTRKYLLILLK